jgi:hypothetical protein
MLEWAVRIAGRRGRRSRHKPGFYHSFLLFLSYCSGESHPELRTQRTAEVGDFLLPLLAIGLGDAPQSVITVCVVSFMKSAYPFGVKDVKRGINQIKSIKACSN